MHSLLILGSKFSISHTHDCLRCDISDKPPDCCWLFNVIPTLGRSEFAFARSEIDRFSPPDSLWAPPVEGPPLHAHLDVPPRISTLFFWGGGQRCLDFAGPAPGAHASGPPRRGLGPPARRPYPACPAPPPPGSGLASAEAVSGSSGLAGGGGRAGRRSPRGRASRAGPEPPWRGVKTCSTPS